jgi:hypothetical protein
LISTANSTSTNFSFSHKKWKKLICRLTRYSTQQIPSPERAAFGVVRRFIPPLPGSSFAHSNRRPLPRAMELRPFGAKNPFRTPSDQAKDRRLPLEVDEAVPRSLRAGRSSQRTFPQRLDRAPRAKARRKVRSSSFPPPTDPSGHSEQALSSRNRPPPAIGLLYSAFLLFSFSRRIPSTTWGLALPRLAFITWPFRKLTAFSLPARKSSTDLGFPAIASSQN